MERPASSEHKPQIAGNRNFLAFQVPAGGEPMLGVVIVLRGPSLGLFNNTIIIHNLIKKELGIHKLLVNSLPHLL